MDTIRDLLTNCIWEDSSSPGLVRLIGCPPERMDALSRIPGVQYLDNPRLTENVPGWFLPENLTRMGRLPGALDRWPTDIYPLTPSGLELRDHQKKGAAFLFQVDRFRQGAILAADPGLGKCIASLQALWLKGYLNLPGVVTGPLGCLGAWCGPKSDATRHYGLEIIPLSGTNPDKCEAIQDLDLSIPRWFFVHYNILGNWASWLFNNVRPKSVILDESHRLMNPKTQLWKDASRVVRGGHVDLRFALTGTPLPKTRMDLLPQLMLVQPTQWSKVGARSAHWAGCRYAGGHEEEIVASASVDAIEAPMVWVYDGQTNTEELLARLTGVLLRYTKADVKMELPDLKREVFEVAHEDLQLDKYWAAQRDLISHLKTEGKLEVDKESGDERLTFMGHVIGEKKEKKKVAAMQLRSLTELISILDEAKVDLAAGYAEELIQQYHHVVVFTWRIEAAKKIHELLTAAADKEAAKARGERDIFKVYGPVDGSQRWKGKAAGYLNKKYREAALFAQADKAIIVATRGSMGESINDLVAAQYLLSTSLAWNPSENIQMESRGHRDGGKNKEVGVGYITCPGTVDDLFLEKLQEKAQESAAISPNDVDGLSLVADLTPGAAKTSDEYLDEILSTMAAAEEL